MQYYDFVSEPRFFSFLLEIDQSVAAEAHAKACAHCGSKLDKADFFRSGLGLPAGSDDGLRRRFSFCCRDEHCRRRVTPESVRFLRGMAYAAVVIVLVSAIAHGLSATRATELKVRLKVSRQTIALWIKWWRERFARSPFWRTRKGRFLPPFDESVLPRALVEAFGTAAGPGESAVVATLSFLAPYQSK